MDFKIGDDITEDNKKKNSALPIIIIVVMAIIIGLIVFFVSNAIFGVKEPKEETPESTQLSLTDENVKILYQYVTYGIKGERNTKFIKEKNVAIDSFTNEEKFYYALQFAQVEDFETVGRLDEKNRKIYTLSNEKVKEYMQRFFGGSVSYTSDVSIVYPFSFRINGNNVGYLTESQEEDGFDVVFDGLEEDVISNNIVEPYYSELVAAYKEPDGTYRLEEKIIYTEVKEEQGIYTVYIFKDFEKTQIIETKTNQTKEMLANNPINIENYKDKASTITYHFGLYDKMLYFDSSTITNA